MKNANILIIGAGAAGLMAARLLAKAGNQVTVLEALGRCGGRIHTLRDELFFKHAELGAEFVHGNLPVTLQLLNEAGISYYPAGGEMWHYQNGQFNTEGSVIPYWDKLMEQLNKLEHDCSIHDFWSLNFPVIPMRNYETRWKNLLRVMILPIRSMPAPLPCVKNGKAKMTVPSTALKMVMVP
ncbi:MAG: FAD-dependent oxidoreductase [Mucilaginibacter sp.]|nr:FAD-dependent oxidoreductase [Mucilaginibacter sp.]